MSMSFPGHGMFSETLGTNPELLAPLFGMNFAKAEAGQTPSMATLGGIL